MKSDIVQSLRGRRRVKNARLGVVSDHLRRMTSALGDARMAKHLKIDPAELKAAIKTAAGRLTWFDADNATPLALWLPGTDGAVKATGKPIQKDGEEGKLSDKSLMDFECIVTTARRDRDGDVLEPKGAIVDPKMPLLWQHVPFQPIGRMVRLVEQSDDKVAARFMIADTALGHDTAVLVEAGCLRISHGFSPIQYNPLKDDSGKDLGGWHIDKYAMMEASVVSIPSNVDAEITAFSRSKLTHPLVKSWCKLLDQNRKKLFRTGWEKQAASEGHIQITVNLAGLENAHILPPAKSATPPPKLKLKADDDEEEEEDDDDTDKTGKNDDDDTGGEGKTAALADIMSALTELSTNDGLSKEAQGRVALVAGMFEDIGGAIEAQADAIGQAAQARDLAGMFMAMAELMDQCTGKITAACEELERVAGLKDLPDGAADTIRGISGDAQQIATAVRAVTGGGQAAAGEGGGDEEEEEDDDTGKTGDNDDDQDEEEEEDDKDEEDDEDKDSDQDDDDDDKAGEKNWTCSACGTDNLDTDKVCDQCGAEKSAKADDDGDDDDDGAGKRTAPRKKSSNVLKRSADRLLGLLMMGETLDPKTEAILKRQFGGGQSGNDRQSDKKKKRRPV